MESYKLVRPPHLNHFGYLFGGELLKWVDETSWLAASKEYPACKFVTVAMDRVEFKRSVRQGTLLRLDVRRQQVGRTSVQYWVAVFSENLETGEEQQIFTTGVTFVCLDDTGRPKRLPDID